MPFLNVWVAEDVDVNSIAGAGSLEVNTVAYGNFVSLDITAGASTTVEAFPATDYDFVGWDIGGTQVSTANPYTFNMPNGITGLRAVMQYNPADVINDPTPTDTYGLRFVSEYTNKFGNDTKIEIEEEGYTGSSSTREIQNVRLEFGNRNSDPLNVIQPSRLSLDLIADSSQDYRLFLDADIRKFRVKYYKNTVLKGIFFVNGDRIQLRDLDGVYTVNITCTDGLQTLDAFRLSVGQFSDTEKLGKFLVRALNQSYQNKRQLLSSIRIFETTMSGGNSDPLDEAQAVVRGFEREDKGEVIPVSLKAAIERVAKPFLARVWTRGDKWYIQSIQEFYKSTIKQATLTTDGVYSSIADVTNGQDLAYINNPLREGSRAFTEITASIQLKDFRVPDTNLIQYGDLGSDAWFDANFGLVTPGEPTPWTLKNWVYDNAFPYDGTEESTTSRVQRVQVPFGDQFARIFGTATSFSDVNLSSISVTPDIQQIEATTLISFSFRFRVFRRSDALSFFGFAHKFGFQIVVGGTQYLQTSDGITFTWTATPTIISYEATNADVWNNIRIDSVAAPIDGNIKITIYQLVNESGTIPAHSYALDIDDVSLFLRGNAELVNEKLLVKGVTVASNTNVYPEIETTLGDALSRFNSAAMLVSDEVTENWAREGVTESQGLLEIAVQNAANLLGRRNWRVTGEVYEKDPDGAAVEIDPMKAVDYDGARWLVNSFSLDDGNGTYQIELVYLDELTT